ncbi:MAG TPA: hypothetical protein VFU43_18655 [Streptosporangiaceae bacterium]|nr:hypothetical protein [Streptosporangiaceae bacterium]
MTKTYADMSVADLRKLAAGIVKGASKARKADLVAGLEAHEIKTAQNLRARQAGRQQTARPASKANANKADTKAKGANKAKAPADAQAATNPGMAKAERFAADANKAGWKAVAQVSDSDATVYVATARSKTGDAITLYWRNGAYQYGPSVLQRKDRPAIKLLNASAARKIMGAK